MTEDMHDKMVSELSLLMEVVSSAGIPINGAFIDLKNGDVPRFALIDNGEGWEICSDSQGKFDLWHEGDLHTPDLDLPTAAGCLAQIYVSDKTRKVLNRMAASQKGS